MTNRELITLLQEYPDDWQVLIKHPTTPVAIPLVAIVAIHASQSLRLVPQQLKPNGFPEVPRQSLSREAMEERRRKEETPKEEEKKPTAHICIYCEKEAYGHLYDRHIINVASDKNGVCFSCAVAKRHTLFMPLPDKRVQIVYEPREVKV